MKSNTMRKGKKPTSVKVGYFITHLADTIYKGESYDRAIMFQFIFLCSL